MSYDTEAIWVIGPMRGGSNWICSLIKPYVEEGYSDYEILRPINKRHTLKKHKNFVFKNNDDHDKISKLIELYPNSKIIMINRDGREVANSIARPSNKSIPVRSFDLEINKIKNNKNYDGNISLIQGCKYNNHPLAIGASSWMHYISNYDKIFDKYKDICYYIDYNKLLTDFDLNYRNLIDFLGFKFIDLGDSLIKNKINENLFESYNTKPLETPNKKIWTYWSEEEKEVFKNAKYVTVDNQTIYAKDILVKYGYEKDNNW